MRWPQAFLHCSLMQKAQKRFDRAIFESLPHILTNKTASKQLGCWKGRRNNLEQKTECLFATQILHRCEAVNRCGLKVKGTVCFNSRTVSLNSARFKRRRGRKTSKSREEYAANEICNIMHKRLLKKPRLKRMRSCVDLSNSYSARDGSQALEAKNNWHSVNRIKTIPPLRS